MCSSKDMSLLTELPIRAKGGFAEDQKATCRNSIGPSILGWKGRRGVMKLPREPPEDYGLELSQHRLLVAGGLRIETLMLCRDVLQPPSPRGLRAWPEVRN